MAPKALLKGNIMDLGFQSDGGGEGENQKREEENKELLLKNSNYKKYFLFQ